MSLRAPAEVAQALRRLGDNTDFIAVVWWLTREREQQRDDNEQQTNTAMLHIGQGRAQVLSELCELASK